MSISNADIILAAFNAAGSAPLPPRKADSYPSPDAYQEAVAQYDADLAAYDQRVKSLAREIKVSTGPQSRIMTQLVALDKAMDPENDGGKVFVGTVLGVRLEQSSKRAIVTLHTGTTQTRDGVPAGCEEVRTERTDNADGRAVARSVQLLVGHRVTVYVELESIKGGSTKVRVLRHAESNGVDPNFDPATKTVTAAPQAA